MKKFILCVALLGTTAAFAEDAGALFIDAGAVNVELSVPAVDAGTPVAVDAGVVVIPSLDQPWTSAKGFYTSVKTGNGWLAAMFMLFFFVGFLRVVGKRVHAMIPDDTKHPVLKPVEKALWFVFDTKVGGWLLNWLSAVGGCLSAAAAAGMAVDATAWKVAIMASTGGTALIELKDDVMEWWDARQLAKAAAAAEEAAKKLAVVTPAAAPPPAEPPKP